MDAYDLVVKMRQLWMENYDKNSGSIHKLERQVDVYVGDAKVTDILYDTELKRIQILLDEHNR